MTNQAILTKAVQKAIEGGFLNKEIPKTTTKVILRESDDFYNSGEFEIVAIHSRGESVVYRFYDEAELIFDHEFAKSLWGEEERDSWTESKAKGVIISSNKPGVYTVKKYGWQRHLQQMVIAPDPIKYLGSHLPE